MDSNGRETFRYDSRGFWMSFNEEGQLKAITCHAHPPHAAPVAQTFSGTVSQVITMGATIKDVTDELGAPDMREERANRFGKFVTMSYWSLGLEFTFRDDSLTELMASLPETKLQ